MRITGGELGGLTLRTPKGNRVRPTQDRVREAVFSMLGEKVSDARVLDLFAGTGALGIEAGSRGAASVTWVEEERRNLEVVRENAQKLHVCECKTEFVCDEVGRWLKRVNSEEKNQQSAISNQQSFDLIFADPPYEWVARVGWDKVAGALRGLLAEGGIFVAEQGADQAAWVGAGWELTRDRVYGGTRICVYRKENEDEHGA